MIGDMLQQQQHWCLNDDSIDIAKMFQM